MHEELLALAKEQRLGAAWLDAVHVSKMTPGKGAPRSNPQAQQVTNRGDWESNGDYRVKTNQRPLNFKDLTPVILGIPPKTITWQRRRSCRFPPWEPLLQQQRQVTTAAAVKEGKDFTLNRCSVTGLMLGSWATRRKAEANGSFFLDSTLFGKTRKLTTNSRPPTFFPLKKAVPQRQKRLWLG